VKLQAKMSKKIKDWSSSSSDSEAAEIETRSSIIAQ